MAGKGKRDGVYLARAAESQCVFSPTREFVAPIETQTRRTGVKRRLLRFWVWVSCVGVCVAEGGERE